MTLPPTTFSAVQALTTLLKHAKRTRAARIDRDRRRVLDALVQDSEGQLADDLERLYVVDRLRLKGPGRVRTSSEDILAGEPTCAAT